MALRFPGPRSQQIVAEGRGQSTSSSSLPVENARHQTSATVHLDGTISQFEYVRIECAYQMAHGGCLRKILDTKCAN